MLDPFFRQEENIQSWSFKLLRDVFSTFIHFYIVIVIIRYTFISELYVGRVETINNRVKELDETVVTDAITNKISEN